MRNYWTSNYVVNKDHEGIICQFADGEKELTLADYLEANPDKTEADFLELKALSDGIYYEQARWRTPAMGNRNSGVIRH